MPEITKSRYVVHCGWDSVPHLTEAAKAELLASFPLHERAARTKGTPGLGSGAIYVTDMADFLVDPFEIPLFWPKCYGLDVGWNRTAAVWAAWDRSTDCVYVYTEHSMGNVMPAVHAAAIRARGDWIPGVIDPASRGRSQVDGTCLVDEYRALGLTLTHADNAVEAGIFAIHQRLSTGRLKVFSTCQGFRKEYLFYRRDMNGKVVKSNDHIMDAVRYLVQSGLALACCQPGSLTEMTSNTIGDRTAGY